MDGYLKCNCHHCEERIEYPVESAGEVVRCPHCNLPTPLVVPGGEEDPNVITIGGGKAKFVIVALIVLLLVVVGVAGTVWYVGNLTKEPAPEPKSEAPAQTMAATATAGSSAPLDGPWKAIRPQIGKFQAGLSAAQVKEGRYVLSGPCTDCHKMYDPVTFERSEWDSILGNMRGRAKLRGREYQDLQLFVQSIRD